MDQDTGRRQGPCALELLVHGVGGTTPERMLGDPRTVLVTGDDTAGIYRRADDVKAETEPDPARTDPVPEAYCWSNLTSGNGARALWLALLPFMVVNLAHWVRPAAPARHPAQRWYDILVRLLALTLTVQFVAAACEVTMDLTAWQCAGSAHCVAGKGWLDFMSAGHGGWWSAPGRRLAVGAAVPALLTGLLWLLSNRTWSAYEAASPPPRPPEREFGSATLSLPGFWYGRRLVARLRAAHTAAGLLTVATGLVVAALAADGDPGGSGTLEAAGRVLAGLVAAGWLAVLLVVCPKGRSEAELDEGDDRLAVRGLPPAALAVLLLAVVYTAWARPGWTSAGRLPGTDVFLGLVVAQGVLVAGLAVAARVLQRRADGQAPVLHGLAGPVVALLAGAVAWVFSGGLAQRLGDWLDRGATPGEDGVMAGPPVLLSWQAAVIPVWLLAVVALALVALVRLWRDRRALAATVPARYPGAKPQARRSRAIATAIARARLTDSAPAALCTAALVTLLLGGGAACGAWLTGEVPGAAARGASGTVRALAQTGQALGSWLLTAAVVMLLTMGRRAYKDASARRTVGILWDVGTFWPRAAHPFAPPCYAERAVPDLTWRMCTWTERTGGRLVLSGHSQGSVLAAAAVWQLDADTRKRIALLTYGSPLHRLYGRWFPAYFGSAPLAALHGELDAWRNLFRDTDPIGGPIGLPDGPGRSEVDCGPLPDPAGYGRTAEHPLPAPILAHSDYQADPAFARERAELLARLAPAVPAQAAPAAVPAAEAREVTGLPAGPPGPAR